MINLWHLRQEGLDEIIESIEKEIIVKARKGESSYSGS